MMTIQFQTAIALDEAAAKSFAEFLAPAIKQAIGIADTNPIQNVKSGCESLNNAISEE